MSPSGRSAICLMMSIIIHTRTRTNFHNLLWTTFYKSMISLENYLDLFLILNITFLVGTALWFRLDHASPKSARFKSPSSTKHGQRALVQEIMWQYSLRSNILLFGCAEASYLVYIGERRFLLGLLAAFSLVNVATDSVYKYEAVALFRRVKRGHRVAAGIICTVSALYFFHYH